jgi:hypothetical protein
MPLNFQLVNLKFDVLTDNVIQWDRTKSRRAKFFYKYVFRLCNLVKVKRRFGGTHRLKLSLLPALCCSLAWLTLWTLKIKSILSFETSVDVSGQHGVISHETQLLLVPAMRASNKISYLDRYVNIPFLQGPCTRISDSRLFSWTVQAHTSHFIKIVQRFLNFRRYSINITLILLFLKGTANLSLCLTN